MLPKSRRGHARAKSVPRKCTHAPAFCAKRLNSGINNWCFSMLRLSELAAGKLPTAHTAVRTGHQAPVPTTSPSHINTLHVNVINQSVKWFTGSFCTRASGLAHSFVLHPAHKPRAAVPKPHVSTMQSFLSACTSDQIKSSLLSPLETFIRIILIKAFL